MRTAAIVPARGGSKRLPGKNLRYVGGRTLVARAIECAQRAGVESVYVSTEDSTIASHAASLGALVRARPLALASDTASTESVIEDWLRSLPLTERPDVIALLEPTAPLRTAAPIAQCIAHVTSGRFAAAYTAVIDAKLHFTGRLRYFEDGTPMPLLDRPFDMRPRGQDIGSADLPHRFYEAGSYVFSAAHFEATHCRMAPNRRTTCVPVPRWEALDVDTLDDLEMAERECRARWEAA